MDTPKGSGEGAGRRRALPRPRRRRSSPRAPWQGPAAFVVAVVLFAAASLFGLQAARADAALPGITVAGIDVGGLAEPEVAVAIGEVDQQRGARTITAVRDDDQVAATAADLGYAIDVEATAAAVMARGRQDNPLLALRDHVRSFFDPPVVAPVESFDAAAFEAWIDRIAEELALPPIEGDLVVTGGSVEVVQPEPGETIDIEGLRSRALEALQQPDEAVVEVPTVVAAPTTTPEQLEALGRRAERAISAPVTLTSGGVELTFGSAEIAALLEVRVPAVAGAADDAGTPDEGLELAIDPDRLLAMIPAEDFARISAEPVDAAIDVSSGQVRVIPAVDGLTFDAEVAAEQLLEVATSAGPRSAELVGEPVEAEFTSEDAEALGITEEVSSFTTQHPCCQSRVTNIQRMADLVRGTIVEPGETFSLNDHVGRRTTDNGFVDGGAISGGEFVEQVGGGVSQFTTTMFNAIFFGGYDIVAFKPHSYYISRYPEGREATLNYDPPVDLVFTNDSPHGIFIDTSYTDTSITVTFYSTTFAEVTTTTGERYGFREPTEQREETDELPAGEERVVQGGRQGFSVDFTRVIDYVDGPVVTENYTTVYLPEPRIVEVGTGTPDAEETPTPSPSPTPVPPSEPTPEPDPEPTAQPAPEPTNAPAPEPTTAPAPEPTTASRTALGPRLGKPGPE